MGIHTEHVAVTVYIMSPLRKLRALQERACARGGARRSEAEHARMGGMETQETEKTTTNRLGGTQE